MFIKAEAIREREERIRYKLELKNMLPKEEAIREIEEKIGYKFELKNLLVQAFIRRSFTNELPDYDSFDIENNEVLELLGDKVLDYIVVKKMAKLKGTVDFDFYNYTPRIGACSGMYSSSLNEGKLTDIKRSIVEKKSLATAMSKLGLQKYLVMGKGDIAMNIQESDSVKEDLFEAILGAVAIDSDWNMEILEKVLCNMHNIEDAINNAYVNPQIDKLWEELFPSERYNIYLYEFGTRDRIIAPTKGKNRIEWRDLPYKEEITICDKNNKILGCYFGVGEEREKAINNAKLVAINDIKQTSLQSPVCALLETLTIDNAVDKMNELCQKGLIEKQEEFVQNGKDEQGNPLWGGTLTVVNYGGCLAYEFYSKKELKKEMSYCVLKEVRKLVKGKYDLFPLIYETLIKKEGLSHKGQVVAIIKDSSNADHELKDLIKINFEDGHRRLFVLDERFVVEGNEKLTSLIHSYYNEKGKNHTQEKEKSERPFLVETNNSWRKEKLLGLVGARVWDEKLGKGTIIDVVNNDDLLIKMDDESRFASHIFSLDHIWKNMAIEKEEKRLLLGKVLCRRGYSIDQWYVKKLIENDERLFKAGNKLVFLKVGDYDFDNGEFPKTCQTLESYYKKLVDTLARERYYTKEEDAKHKEYAYQHWDYPDYDQDEYEEDEVDDVENDEEYLSFCNKMKEIDYNIAMIMDGVQQTVEIKGGNMYIKCIDCGMYFYFSEAQQKSYKEQGFDLPKRCKNCREERRKEGPYVKTSSFFSNAQKYGEPINVAGGLYVEHYYIIRVKHKGEIKYLKIEDMKLKLTDKSQEATCMRYDEVHEICQILSNDKLIQDVEKIPISTYQRLRTES